MVVEFLTQISKEQYVLILMFYVLSRNSELKIICRLYHISANHLL